MLLDTSVVIAYLDPDDRTNAVARAIIDGFVGAGRNPAVVSMITVTEVLVGPARRGDREIYADIVDFLTRFPGLGLREVDFRIAERAATLRARLGLRAPDALIVATGVVGGARRILSNDRDWARLSLPEIPTVVLLEDHLPFSP